MSMYGGKTSVKEQLDYSDNLFMQINRVADIASQPELNLTQFAISVDILAGMISFLKKINFKANQHETSKTRYEKTLMAFEKCLTVLNSSGLLFKYKIKGHIGKEE